MNDSARRLRVTLGTPSLAHVPTAPAGFDLLGTVTAPATLAGALARRQATGELVSYRRGAVVALPPHKVRAALSAARADTLFA